MRLTQSPPVKHMRACIIIFIIFNAGSVSVNQLSYQSPNAQARTQKPDERMAMAGGGSASDRPRAMYERTVRLTILYFYILRMVCTRPNRPRRARTSSDPAPPATVRWCFGRPGTIHRGASTVSVDLVTPIQSTPHKPIALLDVDLDIACVCVPHVV